MYFSKLLFIIFIIFYILLLLAFSIRTKNLILSIFINALSGVILMIFINILKDYLGFNIPVNECSVIASSLFGLPGVIAILLINIIFL